MFHDRTVNAARGRWKGIMLTLGMPEQFLSGKPGPCWNCGGTDRWVFDNKEGSGSSICRHCGARSGMQLALDYTGKPFAEVASEIDRMLGNIKPDAPGRQPISREDRVSLLRKIWAETVEVTPDDPVHRYLATRRIEEMVYPKALRFHPAMKDGAGGIRPAMVAMIGVPGQPKFCSMHRTFLRSDGRGKAEMESPRKLMPGSLPDGACVQLSDWTGSGTIGIAEGIETAMSASALFGIPVWSAINSSLLAKWIPPEGAEEVVVFGDNDPKFGGQAAAYSLAHRLAIKGHEVSVKIPEEASMDWADQYMRAKA